MNTKIEPNTTATSPHPSPLPEGEGTAWCDFEQKLASMKPRLQREITLPKEPGTKLPYFSNTGRRSPRIQQTFFRYVAVAGIGFLLGCWTTYRPEPISELPTAARIVTLPLDDATLATLKRPLDLARLKPLTVFVQEVEPTSILTSRESWKSPTTPSPLPPGAG